jgi:large subunit ribosomal protein L25
MTNDKISLDVLPRTLTGKKVSSLRREGMVPGTVYGPGIEPSNVQVPLVAMEKAYKAAGRHHPVHIVLDGKKRIALIKSVSHDPVKRALRHVSFHAVNQNEKVSAEIPVRLVGEGESPAEKSGLVVLQTLESLNVRALPMSLPDALEVSIVELAEPHQQVTVADITLPEGVELDYSEDIGGLVIASVYEPSALHAANEAAAGDASDEAEVPAENGTEEAPKSEETA